MAFLTCDDTAEVPLLASAARTTDATSEAVTSNRGSKLAIYVDVSVNAGGAGSITPVLQVKDLVSGNWVTIWTAGAAVTTVTTATYYFAAGAISTGGSWTQLVAFGLPGRTWRVKCTANNANPMTYSVTGVVIN